MFDGFQNTTKHDQRRSNSTKQGAQTVKCLVAKQCLMVFVRQTFPVCTGLKTYIYLVFKLFFTSLWWTVPSKMYFLTILHTRFH